MNELDKSLNKKRILVYLAVTFIITYLYEYFFVVRYLGEHPEYTIAAVTARVAVAMFIPSMAVLITRLITKEGFGEHFISFNVKNGKYKYYLIAWFAPSIMTFIGAAVYFLIFRDDFSSGMEYIIDTYAKQGTTGITPDVMSTIAISQAVTAIFLGPVLNCITCFGEEWGWRGYLLPKMLKQFGDKKALPWILILNGIIWGLWHAPIIAMGHNYGVDYIGYPVLGILEMCFFCTVIGIIFSYLTIKSESCIPAVLGHGALNSISAIGILFTKDGGKTLLGPAPTGLIGCIAFIVCAVIMLSILMKSDEKEK